MLQSINVFIGLALVFVVLRIIAKVLRVLWKALTWGCKPQSVPHRTAQRITEEQKQPQSAAQVVLRKYTKPENPTYTPEYKTILETATHLLIGGTTGSGKSVVLNGIMHTALAMYDPQQVNFILIDPKIVELSAYKGLPHTARYVTEPEEVLTLLRQVYGMMMERYEIMDAEGLKKYDGTKCVIVIDELADLLMSSHGKAIKAELVRILQKGRAANIMVIMATQSPSRRVLSAELVLNVPNRIALYCDNAIESRQVIGQPGAERLPWHGSLLYKHPGKDGLKRFDGVPLIPEEALQERIAFWTQQA